MLNFRKRNDFSIELNGIANAFPAVTNGLQYANTLTVSNFSKFQSPIAGELYLEGYLFNSENWGSFKTTDLAFDFYDNTHGAIVDYGASYLGIAGIYGNFGVGMKIYTIAVEFPKALDNSDDPTLAPSSVIQDTFDMSALSNLGGIVYPSQFGNKFGTIYTNEYDAEPGVIYVCATIFDGAAITAYNAWKDTEGNLKIGGSFPIGLSYRTFVKRDSDDHVYCVDWTPEIYIDFHDGIFSYAKNDLFFDDASIQAAFDNGADFGLSLISDRIFIFISDGRLLEIFPATLSYNAYTLISNDVIADAIINSQYFNLNGYNGDYFFSGIDGARLPLFASGSVIPHDLTTKNPVPVTLPCQVPCIPLIRK